LPLRFDGSTWYNISQIAQQLADMTAALEKARPEIELLNSSIVQQHIGLIDTVGPLLQQYANQVHIAHSVLDNGFVQRYIEQLQTGLTQEPEQHEVLENPETDLTLPETHERIVIYSPSIVLLEKLRMRRVSLHDLTWRQFEEVVAELLIQDGFTVELGRGTKDDGKDIVAIKEVRGLGLVMSVWQAKKLNIGNKVGVSVIRELADTRNKLDASKGVIVTTTSLTKGALERIEQDRYLLHKVDGDDLLTWIQRTRHPESGNYQAEEDTYHRE
jgi:hypothetical protein